MKAILSILILCSFVATTHAATLVPSLTTQMQKQSVLNKKNAIQDRKRILEEKKIANQQRLATLKLKNSQPKTIKIASTPISTTKTTQSSTIQTKTIQVAQQSSVSNTYSPASQTIIAGVDMSRVRSTWLSWYNSGRASKGLGAYTYDSRLDSTAHDWNTVFAGSRGTNYHERTKGDGYYNYPIINAWFKARGVNPPVVSGVNHSENVSYGYYVCSKTDCTDDLINAIRSSYIFFINSAVHSKSVYQSNFTKIGFDVIVVPSERRYYVTVHYMTK